MQECTGGYNLNHTAITRAALYELLMRRYIYLLLKKERSPVVRTCPSAVPSKGGHLLRNGDTLGQVARLVDVEPKVIRNVVRNELERNDIQNILQAHSTKHRVRRLDTYRFPSLLLP